MYHLRDLNKKGFTLAETLIAMAIIGIVAAIVIPAVINQSQEYEFHQSAKKIYADLAAATRQIMTNNGGAIWSSRTNDSTSSASMRNEYKKYLSFTKEDTAGNIVDYKLKYYKSNVYVHIPTTTDFWDKFFLSSGLPAAVLSNGAKIIFRDPGVDSLNNLDCYGHASTWGRPEANLYICATLFVDVNGNRGPNEVGKDFYSFEIVKELYPDGNFSDYRFVPSGTDFDGLYCNNNSGSPMNSLGCTRYVIQDLPMP